METGQYMRPQNIHRKEINLGLSHINNVSIRSNKSSIPYDASSQNNFGEKIVEKLCTFIFGTECKHNEQHVFCIIKIPHLLNDTGHSNNAPVGHTFSRQYIHSLNCILQNFNSNGISSIKLEVSNIYKTQPLLDIKQPFQHMDNIFKFQNEVCVTPQTLEL